MLIKKLADCLTYVVLTSLRVILTSQARPVYNWEKMGKIGKTIGKKYNMKGLVYTGLQKSELSKWIMTKVLG